MQPLALSHKRTQTEINKPHRQQILSIPCRRNLTYIYNINEHTNDIHQIHIKHIESYAGQTALYINLNVCYNVYKSLDCNRVSLSPFVPNLICLMNLDTKIFLQKGLLELFPPSYLLSLIYIYIFRSEAQLKICSSSPNKGDFNDCLFKGIDLALPSLQTFNCI
jgi:hypothetical protein